MTAGRTIAELETLALRIETAGFEGLPERILEALAAGRFSLESETETAGVESGFAVLRVVARRVVIDLDPVAIEPPPSV